MAKKPKVPLGRRADDYVVGERLYEGDYSAGTIAAKVQCPERPSRVYMLIRNTKRQYTIYSVHKDAVCSPVLTRMIPESVIERMFLSAFYETEVPDQPSTETPTRIPVPKKLRKKS